MTFRVQNQIRQNATDIRSYIDDLYAWEEEVNSEQGKKPTKPSTQSKQNNKESFPIRGQAIEQESQDETEEDQQRPSNEEGKTAPEKKKELKRDGTSIPSYYEAWDKFDVDKEIEKVEGGEGNPAKKKEKPPQQPANPMQRTSGAERNMKVVVKGGRSSYNEVESLKEKGNLFFKSLEYMKAVEMYTECITKGEEQKVNDELLVVVYSNRAMTYLKLREYLKAEEDCNSALKLNEKHIKSLVRRGQARRKLEKYKEALRDFEKAAEVEPENKDVKEEINITVKKINSIKEEQKKKMILPFSMTTKPKVSVKVEDFDPEKPLPAQDNQKQVNEKSDSKLGTSSPSKAQEKSSPSSKTVPIIPPTETPSDFLTLKNVEGKMVRHEDHANELEAHKQRVHFRLDLNIEDTGIPAHYKPVALDKRPKKSALKRKRQVSKDSEEPPKPAKKVTNVNEIKNSKAVEQGKEMWKKQVIEEYERTVKAAPDSEKRQEEAKRALNITTSSEFLSTWKHIKDSAEACEKLLMGPAKPERFGQIFGEGIDFDYYMELIKFGQKIIETNKKLTLDILEGLSKVKRFDINVKSMIGNEKKVVKEIIEKIRGNEEVNQEMVEQVAQRYRI